MPDQLVTGQSTELNVPAVRGDGITVGVTGTAQDGWGVSGESKKQVGVRGFCEDGWGVAGESKNQVGVRGFCAPGWGVAGESVSDAGVLGKSGSGRGVVGSSTGGDGVFGESTGAHGVRGVSHARDHGGVVGINGGGGIGVWGETSPDAHGVQGAGVFGKGIPAGFFDGDVIVQGTLEISPGVLKIRGFSLGPEQIQALATIEQQVTTLQQQVSGLQQLVNNLQGQLASLQSKEAADISALALREASDVSVLAARISNLGG